MNLNIDLNTIQLMSTAVLSVFSVLLMLLWFQGKGGKGFGWWFFASSLLTVDAVLAIFPYVRNSGVNIHIFNSLVILAYFALALGCYRFANIRLNRYWVLGCFILYLIVTLYTIIFELTPIERRLIVTIFNSLSLLAAFIAILKLSNTVYAIEKTFLITLFVSHTIVNIIWVSTLFGVLEESEITFFITVTPIFIIDAFIIIGLLLLSLAKVRFDLEVENVKSVAIEKALSRAVRETNVANKSKSIFLANMSHELRTPLNIILGFSEVLKMGILGPLNKKQKDFVENIHFGGKRLMTLINDLLSLSNIEAGNLDIDLEKITPQKLMDEYTFELREIARKYNKSIRIIEDLDIDGAVITMIDPVWVKQILIALVDNACKYGKPHGNIWINSYLIEDEDHLRISVKDDGIGILPEEYHNVFKPFNKAGNAKKAIEGTGTGLSIVKGLVEAMNGSIHFESKVGSGTTFWIDLPLVK